MTTKRTTGEETHHVYYAYSQDDHGFESFMSLEQALAFIEERLTWAVVRLDDHTVIAGKILNLKTVEVAKKIAVE